MSVCRNRVTGFKKREGGRDISLPSEKIIKFEKRKGAGRMTQTRAWPNYLYLSGRGEKMNFEEKKKTSESRKRNLRRRGGLYRGKIREKGDPEIKESSRIS